MVTVLVTYEIEADSADSARDVVYYDTEFPVFPHTVGGCVDSDIVTVEEV